MMWSLRSRCLVPLFRMRGKHYRQLSAREGCSIASFALNKAPGKQEATKDLFRSLMSIYQQDLRKTTHRLATPASRQVHEVSTHTQSISELIDKLEGGLPETNMVRVSAKYARDGRISARFYTNSWPEFSAVVARITTPRLSEVADLICYSTSAEKLLDVLKEPELITWGRWQRIEMIDAAHVDLLVKELTPPSKKQQKIECLPKKILYSIHTPSMDTAEMATTVDMLMKQKNDFKLRILEPQHAQFTAPRWPLYADRPSSIRTAYYEHNIRYFDSVAVFHTHQDLTTPVSWITEHPYGCPYGYTIEKYQRSALSFLITTKMILKTMAKGDLTQTLAQSRAGEGVLKKIGFSELGIRNCLIVK